jgi:hypothetical protein
MLQEDLSPTAAASLHPNPTLASRGRTESKNLPDIPTSQTTDSNYTLSSISYVPENHPSRLRYSHAGLSRRGSGTLTVGNDIGNPAITKEKLEVTSTLEIRRCADRWITVRRQTNRGLARKRWSSELLGHFGQHRKW